MNPVYVHFTLQGRGFTLQGRGEVQAQEEECMPEPFTLAGLGLRQWRKVSSFSTVSETLRRRGEHEDKDPQGVGTPSAELVRPDILIGKLLFREHKF